MERSVTGWVHGNTQVILVKRIGKTNVSEHPDPLSSLFSVLRDILWSSGCGWFKLHQHLRSVLRTLVGLMDKIYTQQGEGVFWHVSSKEWQHLKLTGSMSPHFPMEFKCCPLVPCSLPRWSKVCLFYMCGCLCGTAKALWERLACDEVRKISFFHLPRLDFRPHACSTST